MFEYFITWPYGQAVKTSPFHGGNPGSNPGGVTTLFLQFNILIGLLVFIWAHSSVGRASALQAGGHRFEPYCAHQIWPGSSVG